MWPGSSTSLRHRVTPRWICLGIVSTGLPRRYGCGIQVRGGTPSEAQYRPNVVHSSPAQSEVLSGFRSQWDIVKTRFVVQRDLLCPFPRALCDFSYSVHLEGGVLTHRIEVPGAPDKSRFVGLYPEREACARSGLGLGVRYGRPWC